MRAVLKYPGSKWRIAPALASMIPEHHTYVEPYFGSGAVLFNKPQSDIETINDIDSEVTNLFRCIQRVSDRVDRLKCLGNAVVPQQFYPVFQAIVDIERGKVD